MSVGPRTQESAIRQIRAGAVGILLMVCAGAFLSVSITRTTPVASPNGLYNGAVDNQPDILLTKTTYCVAGPQDGQILSELRRAVDENDQASFDDLYARHNLLTLYPGNVIKPLSAIEKDGTQFVELPQPVAGYVTCWLLGNKIH